MNRIQQLISKIRRLDVGSKHFYTNQEIEKMYCMAELGKMSPGILHDILNPLAGLMLYLDSAIISRGKDKDDKYRQQSDYLDHISPVIDSSNQLREFIKIIQADLVDSENVINVDISTIIENVIKILNPKTRMNNVSIVFAREKTHPLLIQKIKAYQIMINLISNAIDSFDDLSQSDRKNQIIITVTQSDGFIFIKISDNGCGISEENLNRIFDTNYTTKKNGVGIGLSGTRRIIERDLSGSIHYTSHPNKGTICYVKIPLS